MVNTWNFLFFLVAAKKYLICCCLTIRKMATFTLSLVNVRKIFLIFVIWIWECNQVEFICELIWFMFVKTHAHQFDAWYKHQHIKSETRHSIYDSTVEFQHVVVFVNFELCILSARASSTWANIMDDLISSKRMLRINLNLDIEINTRL